MHIRRFLVLIAATLTLSTLAAVAWAQTWDDGNGVGLSSRVRSGARVRIVAPSVADGRFEAIVADVRGSDIVLRAGRLGSSPVAIPVDSIAKLEIRRGNQRSAGRYMANGFLIGAGTGVVAGLLSGDDPPGIFAMTAKGKAFLAGIGFGLIGLVLGAITGATTPAETWEAVPTQSLGLGIMPDRMPGLVIASSF